MQSAESAENLRHASSLPDDLPSLALLVLKGDEAARTRFAEAATRIGKIKAVQMGYESVAEDIAQETVIKALGGVHSVRELGGVEAWIHSLARNCVFDHHRREKARGLGRKDSLEQRSEKGFDPSANTKDPVANRLLDECMRELEEEEKLAFRLYCIEGWTLDEAADQTEMSRATLQRRVRSAVVKLSACMRRGR